MGGLQMKKHEKTQIRIEDGKLYMCMAFLMCFFFALIFTFFGGRILAEDGMEASANPVEEVYDKNQNPIDLEQILAENTDGNVQEQIGRASCRDRV